MSTKPPRTPTILATTTFNSRPHRLVYVPDDERGGFLIEREDPDAMGNPSWGSLVNDKDEPYEFQANDEVGAMLYALAFDKKA